MPAAARSRLCSSVSAWAGAFARSAMSSAKSASVIVFAEYLLLLFFVYFILTRAYILSLYYKNGYYSVLFITKLLESTTE